MVNSHNFSVNFRRDDPPSQSTIMATQELLNMAFDWRTTDQSPIIDPIKDMKITDIDFVDQSKRVDVLQNKLNDFQCLQCKKINEHVRLLPTDILYNKLDGASLYFQREVKQNLCAIF